MDKLLRKIGLSGKFVRAHANRLRLLGAGDHVYAYPDPANEISKMTIMLVPFASCSAKLPIYAMFTSVLFVRYKALVMIGLYVIGIVVGILYGLFLKTFFFKGDPIPFVMELPGYRLPSWKSVLLHMWDKAKDFLVKAFTIIFVASLAIWFLQSFDLRFNYIHDSSQSILANIGRFISPIFKPLGFGEHWEVSTALITGLTAKEAIISTLEILIGNGSEAALAQVFASYFTPFSAFCFLIFTLLYMPCVAAMAAVKRELGSTRSAVVAMAAQTGIAWLVTFIVFQIGSLCGL